MTHKEFENLIDELEKDSLDTLKNKNSKYGRKILLICDALQMLLDNFD